MGTTDTNKVTESTEEAKADFIEFLGEPPHGVDFLSSHTLPKGDGLWKRAGVKPTKDVVWNRDPQGAAIGQKGNRFLVPVSDLDAEVVAVLEKTPGYKRVNE